MDFICYFCVLKTAKSCMMTKRKLLYILAATILMLLAACYLRQQCYICERNI